MNLVSHISLPITERGLYTNEREESQMSGLLLVEDTLAEQTNVPLSSFDVRALMESSLTKL